MTDGHVPEQALQPLIYDIGAPGRMRRQPARMRCAAGAELPAAI